jgi:hypothetical protein
MDLLEPLNVFPRQSLVEESGDVVVDAGPRVFAGLETSGTYW